MSLRAKIFIIFSIVVLAILGVSIFLVVYSKKKAAAPQTNNQPVNVMQTGTGNTVNSQITNIPENLPVKKLTSEELEKKSVEQIAKVFLERYATYSNQNDYQNILDVKNLVTTAFWDKLSPQLAKPQTGDYLGVTTKVITTTLADWSQTKATVNLSSVRVEESLDQKNSSYKNATVSLVKTNGNWLIGGISWK